MAFDLQILGDRIEIEERLFLYAHLIDTRQFDRVAPEVFTEDADIMLGGVSVVGRDAFTASLNGLTEMMAGTSHNITNVMIDVRGDEAHAYSRTIAWHWFASPDADPFAPADFTAVGAYQDRLRRTDEGWRIHHRRAMNFGTGVGIGMLGEELRPVIRGMAGRVHQWPAA